MSINAAHTSTARLSHCKSHVPGLLHLCQLPQRGCTRLLHNIRTNKSGSRNGQGLISCAAGQHWDTGCKLVGCGSSAPEAVLSNKDLEQLVQTDDDWIASRTGIRRRHILGKNETLSDHAAKAAQQALDMAGIPAEDVDLIILATSSPDDLFGSACRVCFASAADCNWWCCVTHCCSAGAINFRSKKCYSFRYHRSLQWLRHCADICSNIHTDWLVSQHSSHWCRRTFQIYRLAGQM